MKKITGILLILTVLVLHTISGITKLHAQAPIKSIKYECGELAVKTKDKIKILGTTHDLDSIDNIMSIYISQDSLITIEAPFKTFKGKFIEESADESGTTVSKVFISEEDGESISANTLIYSTKVDRSSSNITYEMIVIRFPSGYMYKFYEKHPEQDDNVIISR